MLEPTDKPFRAPTAREMIMSGHFSIQYAPGAPPLIGVPMEFEAGGIKVRGRVVSTRLRDDYSHDFSFEVDDVLSPADAREEWLARRARKKGLMK